MSTTLFISDLHLDSSRPDILKLFQSFLHGIDAKTCDGLYILGDLFELWIGDDDDGSTGQAVSMALRECTGNGVRVFVMRGNRDFLIGNEFAAATGCQLIPDPSIVSIQGTKALLTHGDALCTDDADYQTFRQLVRNPAWQAEFLAHSRAQRQAIAQTLREMSRQQVSSKPTQIMDVNEHTVRGLLSEYDVDTLIHGHTHRLAVHEMSIDGKPAKRFVLGDWHTEGSVLHCTREQWWLQRLALPPG